MGLELAPLICSVGISNFLKLTNKFSPHTIVYEAKVVVPIEIIVLIVRAQIISDIEYDMESHINIQVKNLKAVNLKSQAAYENIITHNL